MLYVGAKKQDLFKKAMCGIKKLCHELEEGDKKEDPKPKACEEKAKDPTVSRTKGAPSQRGRFGKKRRCTICKRTGHTRRRCIETGQVLKGRSGGVPKSGERKRKAEKEVANRNKRVRTQSIGVSVHNGVPPEEQIGTQQSENVLRFGDVEVDEVGAQGTDMMGQLKLKMAPSNGRGEVGDVEYGEGS
ncbi:hypothetical protein PIB30_022356 [Stylosanthes scabra]|uniref:CCHC-type domain-containing protein n=1 Tax=Stylosanthes scabra TaxID=79078 RepID=A0ABU6W739_9FABA|nr:hypothetical protein [Stylosanthes scabra]